MRTLLQLSETIETAIRNISVSNPGYISVRQETLSDVLDGVLIRRIALVAAEAVLAEVKK